FFFSSRRRHTRFSRDWSSDVCSSDLKAMTPGCTVQACALRDSRKALEKAGIVVLGVSTDPVARLAKFAEKEKLDFTLLSDVDHRSEEHTSELQSRENLVCRLPLEKKN